jgi:hypothetical protein
VPRVHPQNANTSRTNARGHPAVKCLLRATSIPSERASNASLIPVICKTSDSCANKFATSQPTHPCPVSAAHRLRFPPSHSLIVDLCVLFLRATCDCDTPRRAIQCLICECKVSFSRRAAILHHLPRDSTTFCVDGASSLLELSSHAFKAVGSIRGLA